MNTKQIEPMVSVLLDEDNVLVTLSARLRQGAPNWTAEEAGTWFSQVWEEARQVLLASSIAQALKESSPQVILRGEAARTVIGPVDLGTLPPTRGSEPEIESRDTPAVEPVKQPTPAMQMEEEPPLVRRRRGRPPRDLNAAPKAERPLGPDGLPKRGPGRPRKVVETSGQPMSSAAEEIDAAPLSLEGIRTPRVYDDPQEVGQATDSPFSRELAATIQTETERQEEEEDPDEVQPPDLHHGHTNGGVEVKKGIQIRGRSVPDEDYKRDQQRILAMLNKSDRACGVSEIGKVMGITEYRVRKALKQLLDDGLLEESTMSVSNRWGSVAAYSAR